MKTFVFLTLAVIVQAAGNVCLSLGMRQFAAVSGSESWGELAVFALSNPWLWAGAGCLATFTLLFTFVLSWTDLSLALPVISVEIVVNVALAGWVLGEQVSSLHWVGTVMVAAGVALVVGSANEKRPETAAAAEGSV